MTNYNLVYELYRTSTYFNWVNYAAFGYKDTDVLHKFSQYMDTLNL
jgi:hypothetical protein